MPNSCVTNHLTMTSAGSFSYQQDILVAAPHVCTSAPTPELTVTECRSVELLAMWKSYVSPQRIPVCSIPHSPNVGTLVDRANPPLHFATLSHIIVILS